MEEGVYSVLSVRGKLADALDYSPVANQPREIRRCLLSESLSFFTRIKHKI